MEETSKESWRRRRNLALAEADDASSDLGREFSYRNFLRMGWKVPVLEVPGWFDKTTVCRRQGLVLSLHQGALVASIGQLIRSFQTIGDLD